MHVSLSVSPSRRGERYADFKKRQPSYRTGGGGRTRNLAEVGRRGVSENEGVAELIDKRMQHRV